MVNIDDPVSEFFHEFGSQNLHVASQNDQVGLALFKNLNLTIWNSASFLRTDQRAGWG